MIRRYGSTGAQATGPLVAEDALLDGRFPLAGGARSRKSCAMKLYDYSASGNCYTVRLLLALLGTPYTRVPIDIFAGETLGSEYARLNPARETPVLELEGGEIVTQSSAILWLLARGTRFAAQTDVEEAQVLQWLFFEQERLMPGVAGTRFRRLTGRPVPAGREALGREALAMLDGQLGEQPFVVGERCSIADLSLYAYTNVAHEAGFDLTALPAIVAWLGRVERQPGFVNDLEPYPSSAHAGSGSSIYG